MWQIVNGLGYGIKLDGTEPAYVILNENDDVIDYCNLETQLDRLERIVKMHNEEMEKCHQK